ncbi:hypothetical protein K5M76_17080 [Shewanella xiamenensis]|uniref:hypothetical protein n=2 Tax=Shewanella TaxID=22 RepID=UPI000B51B8D9|nr:hypothetical protein [Shewanella xiamenensis]ASF17195.1 hypothetical protein CEQ32_20705 [Shewanella sp. FDAARGOS_354]MCT8859613.1 hypothetical protein [Shewanella xiamenensis]UWG63889.1 hypothetical protein K5M76_17080 [Shewanella xiamenensis]
MINKLLLSIAAFLILGGVALVYLAALHVTTPRFIVKNEASVPVNVTAHWRDKIKDLGELSPDTIIEFEVTDEATMEFKALYSNGRITSSFPAVYFTSGIVTIAVVTDSSVEVSTQQ